MNFLASRLRRYTHRAYSILAARFVEEGVCVPSGSTGAGAAVLSECNGSVAKTTLGMATELLQQSLFGDSPLEDGPPPKVPPDEAHCASPAPTLSLRRSASGAHGSASGLRRCQPPTLSGRCDSAGMMISGLWC